MTFVPALAGKRVLVTGGSSGIGRETALALAKLGADVTLVGRDPQRTRETVEWLLRECPHAEVDSILGDFSTLAGVRLVAAEYRERHPQLDVLINNAGAWFGVYDRTPDGFEKSWAVNHLSYVLLTHELMDLLKAAPQGRIVNVASAMHSSGRIELDREGQIIDTNAGGTRSYNSLRAYSRSKLGNLLFTKALARRLEGTRVTVNALHPGAVATNIGHDMRGMMKAVNDLLRSLFYITPAQGAKTSIYLASAPELEGVSGVYFNKCRPARSSPAANNHALQEAVWKLSVAQCGIG